MRSPEQTHRVRQGECLASIAREYGFEDPSEIYQYAKNADLRRVRPNPNILYPGDTVVIPAHELKTFMLQTGMRHRITVQVPKRLLRIKLQGPDGDLLAGKAFEIVAGKKTVKGNVTSDGLIEAKIPADATDATLSIPESGLRLQLAVGHLDPVHQGDPSQPIPSGVLARLTNLGYYTGPPSNQLDEDAESAIASFQQEIMGREDPDGQLDEATLNRLIDEHGC
jgi:N-acetylmuramoyl-L-alanine amidase